MHSNVRPMVPLLRVSALLFLAFSVFGFGLHARLAQYKPSPPNPTSAKISTETRAAQALKAIDKHIASADGIDRLAFAYRVSKLQQPPRLQTAGEQARIDLSDPMRVDLHGVYRLHGPPAIL